MRNLSLNLEDRRKEVRRQRLARNLIKKAISFIRNSLFDFKALKTFTSNSFTPVS